MPAPSDTFERTVFTLRRIVLYMLRLGTIRLAGPVALAGAMRRELVENRKWISEADYREGLVLAQHAPGPLTAQLRVYPGFVHYRNLGATLAGLAQAPFAGGMLSTLALLLLLTPIACFFAKAGACVFGSSLAIVPFCMAEASPNISGRRQSSL